MKEIHEKMANFTRNLKSVLKKKKGKMDIL